MAKDKQEEKKVVETTVDNIEEVIKNGSVVTEDIAKAAAEKIAKKREEELTAKLIDATIQAEYTQKRMLLSMKKTKKEAEIKLNYLKKITELNNKLKSGDKSLSIDEYNKQTEEEAATARKLIRENEQTYEDHRSSLENQYPGNWSWRMNRLIIG
ncbi:hypothetical protein [Intestinibacter sp.]|uniref:hypothetical protein n=1 Tax=Intestinibacter sp. TaxID=1965304 RepID=UPI003F18196A